MGYATSGIRNIALVGPAGAGKTSLAETLLLQAGAIRNRGSLARGTTVSDFDPQEKRLQHSLDTAICSFDCHGIAHQSHRYARVRGLSRQDPLGAGGGRGGRGRGQRRERRRHPHAAPDGLRARARAVPPGGHQQDRQPRRALRRCAGAAARGVRPRMSAAQPAGRRRRCAWSTASSSRTAAPRTSPRWRPRTPRSSTRWSSSTSS